MHVCFVHVRGVCECVLGGVYAVLLLLLPWPLGFRVMCLNMSSRVSLLGAPLKCSANGGFTRGEDIRGSGGGGAHSSHYTVPCLCTTHATSS